MPETDLLRIRRGVGTIYLLSAGAHAAEMIAASLYSLGRLPLLITGKLWSELYYAHFLSFVLGGLLYLFLSFRGCGVFYYETLVDFLAGIAAFVVLISVMAVLLVKGIVNPWFSLAPSAFLAAYGAGLRRGKAMGFC